MDETIFDKITDVYHCMNSLKWHDALGNAPSGFSSMSTNDKDNICYPILLKLEYLLDHTADMLISWSWWEKHLHRTFEEWLQYQIEQLPVRAPQPKKDWAFLNSLKKWTRKVQ